MIPTPEMIEAACRAYANGDIHSLPYKSGMEAALTAALALLSGEPVGWIWKLPDGDEWQYRDGSEKPDSLGLPKATAARVILQPVYAAPVPLPVAVKIKPLEWKNRIAKTDAGVMYAISGHRKLGERGFILRIVSGLGTENHNIDDFDEAKAAAQTDFETRIRSALSSPVGGTEENTFNSLESDPVTLRNYCQQLLDIIQNYDVEIEGEDNDLIAHISEAVDPAHAGDDDNG